MIGTGNDHSHDFFRFFSVFSVTQHTFEKHISSKSRPELTSFAGGPGHDKKEVHLDLHFLIFPPIRLRRKPAQVSAETQQAVASDALCIDHRRTRRRARCTLFYLLLAMRPAHEFTRAFPVPTFEEVAL
jgi:hypothetical protein